MNSELITLEAALRDCPMGPDGMLELSDEYLMMVLGGQDGTMTAPPPPPPPPPPATADIDIKPIEITVKVDLTEASTKVAETHQQLMHEATEGMKNSETIDALDHNLAEIVNAAGQAVTTFIHWVSGCGG